MRDRLAGFLGALLGALALGLALASCTVPETMRESTADCADPGASIVFVIEGDGHMTYHDASGSEHDAAAEKTDEAVALAGRLHNDEVFILRSGARQFFLLPEGSGDLIHYCKGRQIGRGSFTRDSTESDFEIAAQITGHAAPSSDSECAARPAPRRRILVYYGHTLDEGAPPADGLTEINTHASVAGLARALASMTRSRGVTDSLDLIVLSACRSASPAILRAVAPYTRCLIASPADLHLSHIDTDALALLDARPDIPARELADTIATLAFRRLEARTRTEITIARFDRTALCLASTPQPAPGRPGLPRGARLWLRPAQFGKKTPVADHS